MIGLSLNHCNNWADEIPETDLEKFYKTATKMETDLPIVHFWANLFFGIRYAIVETEYWGGIGDQAAALYEDMKLIKHKSGSGSINKVLKALGAVKGSSYDEFDALGLGGYRNFSKYFNEDGE